MTSDVEPRPTGIGHRFAELLQEPTAAGAEDIKIDRATATYVNKDDKYRITQRSYERQFAQLYFARLMVMGQVMRKRVAAAWPGLELVKILDVGSREEGQEMAVIGTLYKEQKLKPSILDEYSKDRGLRAALGATTFCSDDDTLVLEDEGARMALRGEALPVHELLTGVVVAVRGMHEPGGDFLVHEVLYPGMPSQPPRPVLQEDKYVAFVSGLKLSSTSGDMLQLHMALDMLSGLLGSPEEQQLASRVVRLVVAGGSIGSLDTIAQTSVIHKQQLAIQPIKDMDLYMSELASALPVDVMPGAEDPTNVALPQQPLHRCLFPGASQSTALVRATNPHSFELDGVCILGSSGQPVEDAAKYSRMEDRLSILERCLEWRHLAPTAPDTLTSYPFHDTDPFVVEETPHVMFVGNQPEFATRLVTGPQGQSVRLVAIPSFARTGCLVLLNLRTLACHPITFGSGLQSA